MTIPQSHSLGSKKFGLWDRDMVTGRPGQKPDFKKMTRSVRQWYGHWRVKDVIRNLKKVWEKFGLNCKKFGNKVIENVVPRMGIDFPDLFFEHATVVFWSLNYTSHLPLTTLHIHGQSIG